MYSKHFRGSQESQRLTGKADGEHTFTFTTGPETKMIHIVLFREGTHDRNAIMFDDINISRVKGELSSQTQNHSKIFLGPHFVTLND
jgi:hypothetical protein